MLIFLWLWYFFLPLSFPVKPLPGHFTINDTTKAAITDGSRASCKEFETVTSGFVYDNNIVVYDDLINPENLNLKVVVNSNPNVQDCSMVEYVFKVYNGTKNKCSNDIVKPCEILTPNADSNNNCDFLCRCGSPVCNLKLMVNVNRLREANIPKLELCEVEFFNSKYIPTL